MNTIEQLKHKSGIEEIITPESLEHLFKVVKNPNHYIGFEISGKVHIGQGIATMKVIKRLQDMGVNCQIYLADLHTWINDKLGGDREFIRKTAEEYFIPMFNACAEIVGADASKIRYVLGTDLYHNTQNYLEVLIEVCKYTTLARMMRSITIMGRKEQDSVDFSYLLYPPMQVADIFTLNAHIAHAGMDQRKAHVVALETAERIQTRSLVDDNGNKIKPSFIHHHLTAGLATPPVWPLTDEMRKDPSISESLKMSKSKPGSAIFVSDSEETIRSSIKKAFCPPLETEYNPVLEWIQAYIFDLLSDNESWTVKRDERWGGNVEYKNIEELKKDYSQDKMSSQDLKNNLANWLVELLKPAREVAQSQNIQDIIKRIEEYQVKR